MDLESLAIASGMTSNLNMGSGSCVHSEGCNGVTQEHLERFVQMVEAAERERWASCVRAMCRADTAAGPGFYGDDDWIAAYKRLAALAGVKCGY